MFIKELCQSITLALRSRSMYTLQTKGDQMNEMDLDAAIYFLFVSLNQGFGSGKALPIWLG